MAAAFEYVLGPIRDSAEFTLYRARQHGNPSPVLVVAPTAEQPLPQSLRRLEHEHALASEFEPAWAAKPRPLPRRHEGKTVLIMADPGAGSWALFFRGTGGGPSIWPNFYESRLAGRWRNRCRLVASSAPARSPSSPLALSDGFIPFVRD
jgi:hypothetical protein